MKTKNFLANIDLMTIYTVIVLFSVVFCIVYNLILAGKYFINDHTTFSLVWDYLLHVYGMSEKSVYPNYVMIFPPFAYLIYSLFYRSDATIEPGTHYLDVERKPFSIDTYHIYYFSIIVQFVLYVMLLNEVFKKETLIKRCFFIFAIILSYPMYYMCVFSGNDVLATVLMLLIAMLLLDNEKLTEGRKIIAMILISFASGLKILPAVFGLEFIRKKDYKHAAILIVMGLATFILPFFYFEGIKTLQKFFEIIMDYNELAEPLATSIWYYPYMFVKDILKKDPVDYSVVFLVLKVIFFVGNIFLYFKVKKHWQRMFILGIICAQFISRSFNYYHLYYLIGFVFLIRDENLIFKECEKPGKTIYLILILAFSLMYALYLPKGTKIWHFIFSIIFIVIFYITAIVDINKMPKKLDKKV